jgi:hypothetical protein
MTGGDVSGVNLWAITGTDTLDTSTPNVALAGPTFVETKAQDGGNVRGVYTAPVNATQKDGSRPLGASQSPPAPVEQLATNDDRMNQVMEANGNLWGALNTTLDNRAAVAWFEVAPNLSGQTLTGTLVKQGYVSLASSHADVMFPSIAVNKAGRAVMSLDVSGDNLYPSAGWVRLDDLTATSTPVVHISGAGQLPEDGFTGYPAYNGSGVARWGDYSAAAVGPDGSFWLAGEWVPDSPRTQLANWGTFITHTSG